MKGGNAHAGRKRIGNADESAQPQQEDTMLSQFHVIYRSVMAGEPTALRFQVDGRTYTRSFLPPERLLILGGGHIAQPLCRFASELGFAVTVTDDRPEFANHERFPEAAAVLCDSFPNAIRQFSVSRGDYVAIVTRGHRYDADCLRTILPGVFPKYLGMIGSRRRVGELRNGFSISKLGRAEKMTISVHCEEHTEMDMIHPDRLVKLFTELVETDNPSRRESELCEKIQERLRGLGIDFEEDDTGVRIGGTAGNLFASIDGTLDLPPLLFSAHMDSVDPAVGKKAMVHPDGLITSSGSTVLGADDLSGVAVIIEALTVLRENRIPHRPLEVLFDVSEETYCTGIQQFDFTRIRAKEAYVLDLSGPVGSAAYQAPSILSFRALFHGRAAHAAFSPEDGIHAIKAAGEALALIPCGRVEDTTVNIGTISGGSADNIVPESCTVTGEVRSFDDDSAKRQLKKIEKTMRSAAEKTGAALDFQTETLCAAYRVDPEASVARRFRAACLEAGLTPNYIVTYGGSDNNHFFHQGISGLVIASGMNQCHSRQEYTSVSELEKAARLTLALILAKE